ncbi:hypothetical protein ACWKSP_41840, partial [Micromonosporaceae bacterium Da 78-11]
MVVHDSRFAEASDLEIALGSGQPAAAVVYVDDHRVEILDVADARARAEGSDIDRPRRRLTRTLLRMGEMLVAEGVDLRTMQCGSGVWTLLTEEAFAEEVITSRYDDPLVLRGRYPFIRNTALADDEIRYMGPFTLSGTRYLPMWLPISRALAVGQATDVVQDLDTVFEYGQLRTAGTDPDQAAAAVGAIDGTWQRGRATELG